MKKIFNHPLYALLLLGSCTTSIPNNYTEQEETAKTIPDYCDLVIPQNIAPLNFRIAEDADEAIVKISNTKGNELLLTSKNDLEVTIGLKEWKKMLTDSKGTALRYDIYLKKEGKWEHYQPYEQQVSADSIDRYLTYRLIEPSFQESGHMGIYQYDLERGEETAIFTNHHDRIDGNAKGQRCVNCHSSQRNHPENKLFYYRSPKGGLILTYNGEVKKVNTRCGDMVAGTVYPAWHPTKPLIAFSSNNVKQTFHSYDKSKLDAFDLYSNLVLYDIEKNTISAIRKTNNQQESNPCWSADGTYLYFNSSDSMLSKTNDPRKMLYNIYRIKYNAEDNSWGENELLYEPAKKGKSATYPKASADGKWLLITEADFGTSTQTNKQADLFMIDLKDNSVRPMEEINSPTESDSYHDWSSNSRWIVWCSRRGDGNFARPYFSHIDENGKASKPFILPRNDSHYHDELIKNYNVTEFTTKATDKSFYDIQQAIDKDALQAIYDGPFDPKAIDAYTGATKN